MPGGPAGGIDDGLAGVGCRVGLGWVLNPAAMASSSGLNFLPIPSPIGGLFEPGAAFKTALTQDGNNIGQLGRHFPLELCPMPDGSPIPLRAAYSHKRLEDRDSGISESALMRILDRHPQDPATHTAMIQRPSLPEAVVARLLALLSPALIPRLVSRHPLPQRLAGEAAKRGRGRPEWWHGALFNRLP